MPIVEANIVTSRENGTLPFSAASRQFFLRWQFGFTVFVLVFRHWIDKPSCCGAAFARQPVVTLARAPCKRWRLLTTSLASQKPHSSVRLYKTKTRAGLGWPDARRFWFKTVRRQAATCAFSFSSIWPAAERRIASWVMERRAMAMSRGLMPASPAERSDSIMRL